MQEDNNVGINLVWAMTMLIIVAIIAGAVYYSGILGKKATPDTDVDIKVTAPVSK